MLNQKEPSLTLFSLPTETLVSAGHMLDHHSLTQLALVSRAGSEIASNIFNAKTQPLQTSAEEAPPTEETEASGEESPSIKEERNVLKVLLKIQTRSRPIPPLATLPSIVNSRHLDTIYTKTNLNELSLAELDELLKVGLLDDILLEECQNPEIASIVMDTPRLKNRLSAAQRVLPQKPTAKQKALGVIYGLLAWVGITGIGGGLIFLSNVMVAMISTFVIVSIGTISPSNINTPFNFALSLILPSYYFCKGLYYLRYAWRPMDFGFNLVRGARHEMSFQERRQHCLKRALSHTLGLPFIILQDLVLSPTYELCRYLCYGYQAGSKQFSTLFSTHVRPEGADDLFDFISLIYILRSTYPSLFVYNAWRLPWTWYSNTTTVAENALRSERHKIQSHASASHITVGDKKRSAAEITLETPLLDDIGEWKSTRGRAEPTEFKRETSATTSVPGGYQTLPSYGAT
jgi:hypothetical protein